MNAQFEALKFYQAKIVSAQARKVSFESGGLTVFSLGPPRTDATREAITAEEATIASYQRGIEALKR
jgi:hypothetical protein